jgi:hypothetical protein
MMPSIQGGKRPRESGGQLERSPRRILIVQGVQATDLVGILSVYAELKGISLPLEPIDVLTMWWCIEIEYRKVEMVVREIKCIIKRVSIDSICFFGSGGGAVREAGGGTGGGAGGGAGGGGGGEESRQEGQEGDTVKVDSESLDFVALVQRLRRPVDSQPLTTPKDLLHWWPDLELEYRKGELLKDNIMDQASRADMDFHSLSFPSSIVKSAFFYIVGNYLGSDDFQKAIQMESVRVSDLNGWINRHLASKFKKVFSSQEADEVERPSGYNAEMALAVETKYYLSSGDIDKCAGGNVSVKKLKDYIKSCRYENIILVVVVSYRESDRSPPMFFRKVDQIVQAAERAMAEEIKTLPHPTKGFMAFIVEGTLC